MSDIEHLYDLPEEERAEEHAQRRDYPRVRNRLRLAKALIEMREPLATPSDMGPDNDESWHGAFHLHDGLTYYLLLTCFDLLGQNPDWVDFFNWLKLPEKEAERQAVAGEVAGRDAFSAARRLHDLYTQKYGVKKAFDRFIDGLEPAARTALLDSVRVIHVDSFGDPEKLAAAKAKEELLKKKFLYELRNDFTHSIRTFNTVLRNEEGEWLALVNVDRPGARFVQQVKGGEEKMYFVGDWPFVLYEVISNAIGEPIPNFNVTFSVAVQGEWGLSEYKGANLQQVRDPEQLSTLIEEIVTEMRKPVTE